MCVQLYGSDLESQFSQFQDWLRVCPLYKGKASVEDEEEDEEERLMGKFKVLWMDNCLSVCLSLWINVFINPYCPSSGFLPGLSD